MKNTDSFCNDIFETKKLYKIINDLIFPIGESEIEKVYNVFKEEFEKGWNVSNEKLIFYDDFKEKLEKIFCIQPFANANFWGIDFPTWINWQKNKNTKRIMIVGIDPLRNYKTDIGINKKRLVLGTPYGFQIKKMQTEKNKYWKFLNCLPESTSIYLTDTFKLYFNNAPENANKKIIEKERSYNQRLFTNPHFENNELDIHQEIFYQECQLVKPDLIVTLGSIPKIWFSAGNNKSSFKQIGESIKKCELLRYRQRDLEIPLLALPHLSGRVFNAKELLKPLSDLDIPEAYAEIVSKFLKNLSGKHTSQCDR